MAGKAPQRKTPECLANADCQRHVTLKVSTSTFSECTCFSQSMYTMLQGNQMDSRSKITKHTANTPMGNVAVGLCCQRGSRRPHCQRGNGSMWKLTRSPSTQQTVQWGMLPADSAAKGEAEDHTAKGGVVQCEVDNWHYADM